MKCAPRAATTAAGGHVQVFWLRRWRSLSFLLATVCVTGGCGATASAPAHRGIRTRIAPGTPTAALRRSCPTRTDPPSLFADLTFVNAQTGFAIAGTEVLGTSDGGQRWRIAQTVHGLIDNAYLNDIDFVTPEDGWVLGPGRVEVTTNGGRSWQREAEPRCGLAAVDLVSASHGFAISFQGGGTLLSTADGGMHWHAVAAPGHAQSVCFENPRNGWLGVDGEIFHTSTAGRHWRLSLSYPSSEADSEFGPTAVGCSAHSAWAVMIGQGVGSDQEPHVGYHFTAAGWRPLYHEGYFPTGPPAASTPESPGADPGPFAVSPSGAVFIDTCGACGYGTSPFATFANTGRRTLSRTGIPDINDATGVSFINSSHGWVIGGLHKKRDHQTSILVTLDGGQHWKLQYAGVG